MIVCTGGNGTIGQFLPASVIRLRTRLEDSIDTRVQELKALGETPTAFIHLAALTSVKEADAFPERARQMNVEGAVKWLEAADRVGVARFIFVSTSHVFKPTLQPVELSPSVETNATAAYGASKAEAEKAMLSYAGATRVIIARIFSVISPKMREGFLYPELLRRAREKDFKALSGHQNVRDFIDAEVAARQLMGLASEAVREDDHSRIVHLAGRSMSVRELAEDVMAQAGIKPDEISSMFPLTSEPANFLISQKERT